LKGAPHGALGLLLQYGVLRAAQISFPHFFARCRAHKTAAECAMHA
jgi:hypothetical protein